MSIITNIEKFLQVAVESQEAETLTQVVVMRCFNGIDSYLFRRADFGGKTDDTGYVGMTDALGYHHKAGEAFAPNWDNDGWPLDNRGIDVIDISDYVEGFDFSADNSFAAASMNLSIANVDSLFSPDCLTFDVDKFLDGHVVSGALTPRNPLSGSAVTNAPITDPSSYGFKFLPNYMFNPITGDIDIDQFCPMFRENNVVKVREGYRNPNWDTSVAFVAADENTHPIIWRERFTGLISAASPSIGSGGRPSLNVVCHDLMKLATRSTSERVYVPMLVTNDAVKDADGNVLPGNFTTDPETNKVFYDPRRVTHSLDDVPFGFSPINFLNVAPESLSPQDEKVAIGRNLDWSNVPEPQVYVGGELAKVNTDGVIELVDTSGNTIADELNPVIDPATGVAQQAQWANGFIVRWYDDYEPVGRPKKIESWNNLYFMQDMFIDPNAGLLDSNDSLVAIDPGKQSKIATHPFISTYTNWSFVVDTMIDLHSIVDSTDGLGPVLFALYVEGAAKVYIDGALVAASTDNNTLSDYLTYRSTRVGDTTNASSSYPAPPLALTPVHGSNSIMQVAENGVLCWTLDLPIKPVGGGNPKLYHMRVVYQCGSRKGYRNICALRWYGQTYAERQKLMQNAAGMEGVPANPLYRNIIAGEVFHIKPYSTGNDFVHESVNDFGIIDKPDSTKISSTEANIPPNLRWANGSLINTVGVPDGAAYLNQAFYWREPQDGNFLTPGRTDLTNISGNQATLTTTENGLKLTVDDPQWYDASVVSTYSSHRTPVMGKPCPSQLFKAFMPITGDDPDFGFNVLYSRGGVEFNIPMVGFGLNISPDASVMPFSLPGMGQGVARYVRFGAQAKYVYKSQIGSPTVDDILSDLMIEDAFGVDKYGDSLFNTTGALPIASPLYGKFRLGWVENGKNFVPKVSLGQTQKVPDNIMFNLENSASSHEAMRKLVDVMQSNFFVYSNPRGQIRGKFQTQEGLPRLIPPAPPALQPDIADREFYCMTLVGNNKTLDLPSDIPLDSNDSIPLIIDRESTFMGEVVLDRILSSEDSGGNITDYSRTISGSVFNAPIDNPYPSDTNVTFPTINIRESRDRAGLFKKPRYIVFQPVILEVAADDPNSTSVTGRSLSDRDTILYYLVYRRRWHKTQNVWGWERAAIQSNADGTPVVGTLSTPRDPNSNGVYTFNSYFANRQAQAYESFYVMEIDSLPWLSCSAPPSGQYDPSELASEWTRKSEKDSNSAHSAVRPLIVGYDYRIDAMESLSLPRDDFNIASRVLIQGQKNSWSMPDLVQDTRTNIVFHGSSDSSSATFLPTNNILPIRFRDPVSIKDSLTQISFNGASKTGFTAGWYLHGNWSNVVNSCSTVYVVDEDIYDLGARPYNEVNGVNVNAGSDPWPPYHGPGAAVSGHAPYDYAYGDENNYGTAGFLNGESRPGDWSTSSNSWGFAGILNFLADDWTDFKFGPNQSNDDARRFGDIANQPGWPHLHNNMMKIRAKKIPHDYNTNLTEYGWYTAEGKVNGYYSGINPSSSNYIQMQSEVIDRIRGGFIEDVKFDFVPGSQLLPDDENVINLSDTKTDNGQPWDWKSYVELFTLDFGREVDIGEIGMAVGYAPYEIAFPNAGMAKISLGNNTAYHRWLAQTSAAFGAYQNGDMTVITHQVTGFAGPSDASDAFYDNDAFFADNGRWASLGNWYINEQRANDLANGAPWIRPSSQFKVVHEYNRAISAGTGAALSEFFVEIKLGRISYNESGGKVINWQTIATDQRVQTQSAFWKWDENFFKNMPTKGQYLKFRVRMPSPTSYVGFLTRTHCHRPLKWIDSTTPTNSTLGMTILGVKKSKTTNVTGNASYRARWKKNAQGLFRFTYGLLSPSTSDPEAASGVVIAYKLKDAFGGGYYYANDPSLDWNKTEYIVIDGGKGGIVTFGLEGAAPTVPTDGGAFAGLFLNRYFEIEGTRNIGNMLPLYQGVNVLPSIAAKHAFSGLKNMRLTPWFGALPAIYHSMSFVCIQKLYVYEKKVIKQNYILRPSTGEFSMSPLKNVWYDPKIDRDDIGKTPYRTNSIPKRSKTKKHDKFKLDATLPDLHHYNHRSIFVSDPSSYTEGRAFTTAFQKLQESKQPLQAGNVSVIYFPELFIYQTVLVNEACTTGYVKKPNGDPVAHFGRTFLIEKLNVSNRSGRNTVSITLRDYHNG